MKSYREQNEELRKKVAHLRLERATSRNAVTTAFAHISNLQDRIECLEEEIIRLKDDAAFLGVTYQEEKA